MQVRVARPTLDLDRALAFYRDAVGLEILSSFDGHDGYSGAILGVPDEAVQLELVVHEGVVPAPTPEDQLVLYLGSVQAVADRAASITAAGYNAEPAIESVLGARRCDRIRRSRRLLAHPLPGKQAIATGRERREPRSGQEDTRLGQRSGNDPEDSVGLKHARWAGR